MDLSHHAYCLIGSDAAREDLLKSLKKDHHISPEGNPDFFDRKYQNFTIDDAREVKSLAETKPTSADGKKIFVITTNGITVEAQNALLKLLEEPGENVHFFLIIPSVHLLLPTVKSRISFIGGHHASHGVTAAEEFLKIPPTKRLDFVKSFMEEISKEKRPKQDAVDLLKGLEEAVHKKGMKGNAKKLEAIMLAEKYSTDRAPSMKMLLEYVAMSLS